MKKVLIQDKSSTLEALDSLRDLVQMDFDGDDLEIEVTDCLAEAKLDIIKYDLIISHPHIVAPANSCCLSRIERVRKKRIPIIFTYKVVTREAEELRAISKNLEIPLRRREYLGYEFYSDLIRSLEGNF
jgi:hypothetical protein